MKIKALYLAFTIILLVSFFSYFNTFEGLEFKLRDFLQSKGEIDSNIVIVGIDDESLEKLGQWPWPRDYVADVIEKLGEGGAAAIGVDIIYSEEARTTLEDEKLTGAVKRAGNVVLPVYGDFSNKYIKAGSMEAISLKKPFDKLEESAATGHINTMPDSDQIVRRHLESFRYKNQTITSFSYQIYRKWLKATGNTGPELSTGTDDWNRRYIRFGDAAGKWEVLPFYRIRNGDIPPEYFQDKIVLIGPYAVGLGDFYFTTLDHSAPMFGVEIHANILQNYIYDQFRQTVPDAVNLAVLFVLGLLCFLVFKRLSPAKSGLAGLAFIALFLAGAVYMLGRGYILNVLYPVLLIIALYILVLAYRYIEEMLEKRRITGIFGRYVAPQVVDRIIEGGEESLKLGGSRREISALFVDIRGFTPMSEKLEPEQVVDILNDYLNLTATSIFTYGGTLDKFIGDATMAIFNAPLDLEDHAFKAVQTAWAMKQGSMELKRKLEEKFGRSVDFGIGVNTGYAVVGNIGAKFRMDYTAIGDTVNTAARLESNSKPGQILISQATYEKVKDRVLVTDLGEIKVKGKEQGVPVYQLDGVLETGGEEMEGNSLKAQAVQ